MPFGGVKIVMIGDFLQLPPIVTNEELGILADLGYANPYLVASKALQDLRVKFVEMTKVFRQNDADFIRLLGEIRVGGNTLSAVNSINELCCRPHRRVVTPIILTATNEKADSYNRVRLAALASPTFTYVGIFQGMFNREERLPVPMHLEFKVGPGS